MRPNLFASSRSTTGSGGDEESPPPCRGIPGSGDARNRLPRQLRDSHLHEPTPRPDAIEARNRVAAPPAGTTRPIETPSWSASRPEARAPAQSKSSRLDNRREHRREANRIVRRGCTGRVNLRIFPHRNRVASSRESRAVVPHKARRRAQSFAFSPPIAPAGCR